MGEEETKRKLLQGSTPFSNFSSHFFMQKLKFHPLKLYITSGGVRGTAKEFTEISISRRTSHLQVIRIRGTKEGEGTK